MLGKPKRENLIVSVTNNGEITYLKKKKRKRI